jgi:hypothetical protein
MAINTKAQVPSLETGDCFTKQAFGQFMMMGEIPRFLSVFLDRYCRKSLTIAEIDEINDLFGCLLRRDHDSFADLLHAMCCRPVKRKRRKIVSLRVIDSLALERKRSRSEGRNRFVSNLASTNS